MTSGSPSSAKAASSVTAAAEPKLVAIIARARNGVIGRDGAMPWRLSSDFKRFKSLTWGKPILMGRRTFASLPTGALPGRANLVWTRAASTQMRGAWAFSDLEAMLAAARAMALRAGIDEICAIGGAELLAALETRIDAWRLTEVDAEPHGDVAIPAPDPSRFVETACEEVPAGPKDDYPTIFRSLERRS